MTIHFTKDGIYADTEEERLAFYDRLCAGDPVILGHLAIHELQLNLVEEETNERGSEGDTKTVMA